jgi:hypothetical protein
MSKEKTKSTKEIRQKLGGLLVDLKYLPDDIILIEKKGEENFVGCLCSIKFLEELGYSVKSVLGSSEVVETEEVVEETTKPKSKKK